jgi:hypothetical protein
VNPPLEAPGPSARRIGRRTFLVSLGAAAAGALLLDCRQAPKPQPAPSSHAEALQRSNIVVLSGTATTEYRNDEPGDDFTLDARAWTGRWRTASYSHSMISIGNDGAPVAPSLVGGLVIGDVPWEATWQTVKDRWDASGVRIEGLNAQTYFHGRIKNMEDGYQMFPSSNPNGNATDTFLAQGIYMEHIRDDAFENDQVMPGAIVDCYIEGTNVFLSEQADSQDIHNPSAVVHVQDCLVHMIDMPNQYSSTGHGYGQVFKWQGPGEGTVVVTDNMFLLDSFPIRDNPWPEGTYARNTVILGPSYSGGTDYLPATGVTVTRNMRIWRRAVAAWLRSHPAVPAIGPP